MCLYRLKSFLLNDSMKILLNVARCWHGVKYMKALSNRIEVHLQGQSLGQVASQSSMEPWGVGTTFWFQLRRGIYRLQVGGGGYECPPRIANPPPPLTRHNVQDIPLGLGICNEIIIHEEIMKRKWNEIPVIRWLGRWGLLGGVGSIHWAHDGYIIKPSRQAWLYKKC